MDRDTISKLRLDKRLIRRRGWISPEDVEREFEALPDVSEKIASDSSASGEEGASEPEKTPPLVTPDA